MKVICKDPSHERLTEGKTYIVESSTSELYFVEDDLCMVRGWLKDRFEVVPEIGEWSTTDNKFVTNSQGGVKETVGKLDWCLLPILALTEVVRVLDYGKRKYSADNWKLVDPYEYKKAAYRHWVAYLDGEKVDPESGFHHLAHLGCDVLFLLWFELTGKMND